MKPLLFLDVDGVVNCFGGDESHMDIIESNDDYGHPETLMIPHGTADRIRWLTKYFTPVWATAWLGQAHGVFQPHLSLSETSWPHVEFGRLKLPEIITYALGVPWAWVDDIAAWELDQLGWNHRDDWSAIGINKRPHRYLEDNTFIVCPNGNVGLTDPQTHLLIKFAESL